MNEEMIDTLRSVFRKADDISRMMVRIASDDDVLMTDDQRKYIKALNIHFGNILRELDGIFKERQNEGGGE